MDLEKCKCGNIYRPSFKTSPFHCETCQENSRKKSAQRLRKLLTDEGLQNFFNKHYGGKNDLLPGKQSKSN